MASPATPLASALAETFRDEEDQVRAQQLFELNAYRSNVDTQEYRKIAQLIAELALAGKGQSESQRDIEMAALRLAGLANGSISLLEESQQKEVLDTLLPRAMGEGPDSSFYSEHLSQLLLRHASPNDTAPVLKKNVKEHLDKFLNKERVEWLVSKVESGSIVSPFDETDSDPIEDIKAKYGIPKTSQANKAKPNEDTAKVSREALAEKDVSASLEERIHRDAAKRKFDIDVQVDALNKMNALFAKPENASWAEKNVWDKVKGKIGEKVDRITLQDPIKYPKESLFSKTLVDMDPETMLTKRELLRFNTLGSFKAKFASAKVSDDVYSYAALSAMSKGIRYPMIKSTFTDPNESFQFVNNMTKALVEAGYDVNDIRVSPHLRRVFEERIKPNYAQENALEEAPEELVADPELEANKLGRQGEGPVLPPSNEQSRFEPEAADKLEFIKNQIKEMNEHPLKISKGMNDPDKKQKFSDLSNEDVGKILQLAPLLNMPDQGWKDLVAGTGLAPESRKQVEATARYITKLVDSLTPDEAGKTKLDPEKNNKQLARLKELRPILQTSMPDLYEKLSNNLSLLNRPSADNDGFIIPDELWLRKPEISSSSDEYSVAMSQQSFADWEKAVANAKNEYMKGVAASKLKSNNSGSNAEDLALDNAEPEQTPPSHFKDIPPPESELSPIPSEEGVETAPVMEEKTVSSKSANQEAEVTQEVTAKQNTNPYAGEWVARVSKENAVVELASEDIQTIANLSEDDVNYFNTNPPAKEDMSGSEFANLRRHIQDVRDAINPFQESPSEQQIDILRKVPRDYLQDILPEGALNALDEKATQPEYNIAADVEKNSEKIDPMSLTDKVSDASPTSVENIENVELEKAAPPEKSSEKVDPMSLTDEVSDSAPTSGEKGDDIELEKALSTSDSIDNAMGATEELPLNYAEDWTPSPPEDFEDIPLPTEHDMGPQHNENEMEVEPLESYSPRRR
ncbi:hypothetical protein BM525_18640 (plasmid) [Alteromonas mediterranea]|uniref:Uncharacterized protein n=1 Tax=Alteromonas mediterranea TaxID=314275 RepID=A0AAC9JDX6_9ALTE|nr:hypothetical protein [Alteromonas mediterranea]APD91900.1 hypothetical protein BM524_18445 [Alteromonas mediterranea]APD99754.1 hypothetical protein BM525_18640 [Alteromonas mediterranea]